MENVVHICATQYYFKHVHTTLISQLKKYLLKQGIEFGITVGASPYSFSAKAMSICIIDEEKWSVVELLAGCNVYEDSPDGEGTVASMLSFMKRFGLKGSVWKFVMMDGCEFNTAAMNWLVSLCDNVKINRVRCLSCFLSLVGKNMDCGLLRKVIKYLLYMKQSPKCRGLFRKMFNKAII